MKDEKELIERMNSRSREIPITRKQNYETPTVEVKDDDSGEGEVRYADCGCCPVATCPEIYDTDYPCDEPNEETETDVETTAVLYDSDFDQPHTVTDVLIDEELADELHQKVHPRKLTESEREELDELLEKSRRIKDALKNRKTNAFGKPVDDRGTDLDWYDFGGFHTQPLMRDEQLINQWKSYTKRAKDWIAKHKGFPESIAKALLLDDYGEEEKCANGPELTYGEKQFKSIVDKMYDTYQKKNADYGDSFTKLFDKFGMQSAIIRLTDKLNRLESLNTTGKNVKVNDESVEDTLLDLANYAILTVIELRKKAKK